MIDRLKLNYPLAFYVHFCDRCCSNVLQSECRQRIVAEGKKFSWSIQTVADASDELAVHQESEQIW